jgi:hypothetical protein
LAIAKSYPPASTTQKPQNEPIYERAGVKRGGADFVSPGFPHIPFAVGFGRSGPSQTCRRTSWLCDPQHIL